MSTVVVAIIFNIKASQKYLIVRRNSDQSGAGCWEFPGGKVEDGESKEVALQREIYEELQVHVDPLKMEFMFQNVHQYQNKSIDISFYLYEVSKEIPLVLVDHDDFKWCDIHEIFNYKIAEADIPVMRYIQKVGATV